MTTTAKLVHLVRPFETKAFNARARTVDGIAAAYTVDHGSDLILPGAFAKSLQEWRRANKQPPKGFVDSHMYGSIFHVIGKIDDAEERADGLWCRFSMVNDSIGEAAFARLAGGFVTGLSIGYIPRRTRKPTPEETQRGIERVLIEIALEEVSAVQYPMNPDARVIASSDPDDGKSALTPAERAAEQRREAILSELAARADAARREEEAQRDALISELHRRAEEKRQGEEQRRQRILDELERPLREAAIKAEQERVRALEAKWAADAAERLQRRIERDEEERREEQRRRNRCRRITLS
jgi:HK97 family phage prohead protease